MKFLHTADWHLGRSLYGRKRYDEFAAFLEWLSNIIQEEHIDALLVAGDVFDTNTPSNRAQELYYRFLCRVAASVCRHIVIIAGNHDSPSFLNAPKELLRVLNVYVVGAVSDNPEDEVVTLKVSPQDSQAAADEDIAIVCAVPYLRDKDIRTIEAGETIDDKNRKLVEGIKKRYAKVVAIAERERKSLQESVPSGDTYIPIIAMGHLFTAGGKTVEGDGVRELYVGSLAHVGGDAFPASIDYLALGHLHVPQRVGRAEHIRYSGSPIPMGFGEATQEKSVVIIEFNSATPNIQEIQTPCFQQLVRIVGSLDDIHTKLEQLNQQGSRAWLEIEYTGRDMIGNLREMIEEALVGSAMEILRIKNKRVSDRVINATQKNETLDDLDTSDVFIRCLDAFDTPEEDRAELTVSYNEIIQELLEDDENAE